MTEFAVIKDKKIHAEMILNDINQSKLCEFVGKSLLNGIKEDKSFKEILIYIFGTYHNLSIEKISTDSEVIRKDIKKVCKFFKENY